MHVPTTESTSARPTVRVAEKAKLGVFISYSRADNEFADQLVAALGAFGFHTTIDRIGIHSRSERWAPSWSCLLRANIEHLCCCCGRVGFLWACLNSQK